MVESPVAAAVLGACDAPPKGGRDVPFFDVQIAERLLVTQRRTTLLEVTRRQRTTMPKGRTNWPASQHALPSAVLHRVGPLSRPALGRLHLPSPRFAKPRLRKRENYFVPLAGVFTIQYFSQVECELKLLESRSAGADK